MQGYLGREKKKISLPKSCRHRAFWGFHPDLGHKPGYLGTDQGQREKAGTEPTASDRLTPQTGICTPFL